MDAFRILARGAKITDKHRDQLKKFDQGTSKPADVAIDRKVDFFGISAGRTKRRPSQSSSRTEEKQPAMTNGDDTNSMWIHRPSRTRVSGHDVPKAVTNFSELHERLRTNLARLGYAAPSPIQSESIPVLLAGRDLLACAPTGSGKTLAFLLPILQGLIETNHKGKVRALVVAPTRELAAQTYETAVKLARGTKIKISILDKSFLSRLQNAESGSAPGLLISTPLRLVEAIKANVLDLSKVRILVLDEADRLLGKDFVEQVDEIIAACTKSDIIKAVFSATFPANVEELANSIMHTPVRVLVGHKEGASETIAQKLVYCGNEAGKLTEVRQMLRAGEIVPPILVFTQNIARAKALFHELVYDKINVDVIHSELTQTQRDKIVASYKRGDIWVLICTDVLARGIDFHGVNLVINYDVPLSAQSYVHRIGRTGRAGRAGEAVTFYTKQDLEAVRAVANVMRQSGCVVPDWLLESKKVKRKIPAARADISTVPSVIKRQRTQKRQMVEASKRRAAKDKAS